MPKAISAFFICLFGLQFILAPAFATVSDHSDCTFLFKSIRKQNRELQKFDWTPLATRMQNIFSREGLLSEKYLAAYEAFVDFRLSFVKDPQARAKLAKKIAEMQFTSTDETQFIGGKFIINNAGFEGTLADYEGRIHEIEHAIQALTSSKFNTGDLIEHPAYWKIEYQREIGSMLSEFLFLGSIPENIRKIHASELKSKSEETGLDPYVAWQLYSTHLKLFFADNLSEFAKTFRNYNGYDRDTVKQIIVDKRAEYAAAMEKIKATRKDAMEKIKDDYKAAMEKGEADYLAKLKEIEAHVLSETKDPMPKEGAGSESKKGWIAPVAKLSGLGALLVTLRYTARCLETKSKSDLCKQIDKLLKSISANSQQPIKK